ncbi:MAG: hypothetical protein GY932_07950, partial [Arcobacter sp.]|nr:hypothetical protein [Arcobacter sp.]
LGGKYGGHSVNAVYGSLYNPDDLGSGGGGDNGNSGGNGGGLVRIRANDIVLNGHIRANGGDGYDGWYNGGGSGGGIYVETGTLSGGGMITANGGKTIGTYGRTTGGGGGRIAIYYDDISGFGAANIAAYGGKGSFNGGAGTIYTKSSTQTHGDLIVDNKNTVTTAYTTPLISVGTGTSTDLTANTMTDGTRSWRTDDLVGIYLNPNTGQGNVMKILNNDGTTITTDLNDGDMTMVASAGSPYRGLYIFDTLDIKGLARIRTDDDIKVLAPNTVNGLEIDGAMDVNSIEVDNFAIFVNNGGVTVNGKITNASDYNLYNSTLVVDSITSDTLTLTNNSLLTHPATTTADEHKLVINTNTLTIDIGSSIDVTGKGYLGANSGGNLGNYGRTIGNTTTGGSFGYSAGGYGGLGGKYGGHSVNAVYGSLYNPDDLGSGGGGDNGNSGGNGGGLVKILANDIVLNGHISANGGDGFNGQYNGGGSGGGVYVDTGTLSGGGMITANGGKTIGTYGYTTGGGGGRIAIYYDDISGFATANIAAYGGKGSFNGGAGTIYTKSSTETYGDLIVDNVNIATTVYSTPLISVGTGTS